MLYSGMIVIEMHHSNCPSPFFQPGKLAHNSKRIGATGLYIWLYRRLRYDGASRMVLLIWITVIWVLLPALGCQNQAVLVDKTPPLDSGPDRTQKRDLPPMGYSIQMGAFSHLANAIRLTASLERHGLDAYYYPHKKRLYKVRFGNYATREAALLEAEGLMQARIIDDYYIVSPDDYLTSQKGLRGLPSLRDNILVTAQSFIGIPYRWGGASPNEGFDCSGLTMAVYRLNGLDLPRSSKEQYRIGVAVQRKELARGDLVFFATSSRNRVSHVGIYSGYGRFIHAPGKGKKICYGTLSNRYFNSRYVGGRRYL